jgi:predicted CopG family antitoxin
MATTIQISDNVHALLQNMKLFERESYNDVIERMLEDNLELSEQTKKDLEEAKAQVRKGEVITQDEVEKRFGL